MTTEGKHPPVPSESLTAYFAEIAQYRLLSREEEAALAVRIRAGETDALNQLVCANLKFVVTIAKQYQNRGVSLSDLVSEGNVGLIRAAERFDEGRGVKFISYAVWWIRQTIHQAIADQSEAVRVPAGELMHVRHAGRTASLDAPLAVGGESNLLDLLPDDDQPPPDAALLSDGLDAALHSALHALRPREAEVVRLYFGLEGDSQTLEQIAARYGITRERVRQIKDKALAHVRTSKQGKWLAAFR